MATPSTERTATVLHRIAQVFAVSVRRPRAALALCALCVVLALLALSQAHVDMSIERLYPRDSPQARKAARHRARFGREDDALLVIREGPALHADIGELQQRLDERSDVVRTVSSRSFEVLALDQTGALTTRHLKPNEVHPLASGVVVAEDGDAGAVLVQVAEEANTHASRDALITAIERETEALGGQWHIAGLPVVRTWYVRLMQRDMTTLIPIATLISALFLWLGFRDVRRVVLGTSGIAIGGLLAAGAHAATGAPFDMFAPAFVAVVLVVGTSDVIHLLHRYDDLLDQGLPRKQAAAQATTDVALACLLTSATTALGFFALLTTELPPIRSFGLSCGIGVLVSFFVAFVLVPALLVHLPARPSRTHTHRAPLPVWRRLTAQHPTLLLVVSSLTVGIFALGITRLQVEYRILEDLAHAGPVATAHTVMEDRFGAVLPLELDILSDRLSTDPALLDAVDALAADVRSHPQVGHVVSISDLLRAAWTPLWLDVPEAGASPRGLPPTKPAVAQTLLLMELAGVDAQDGLVVEEADGTHLRIQARIRDHGHAATVALVDTIEAHAERHLAPIGASVHVTGAAWLAQEVNGSLTRQFGSSFALALGIIGLAWLGATRSPRRTLLALVPNAVPVVMHLGLLGWLGLELKPSTAMVMSIGLGIAVDDTIHFLTAYERARSEGLTAADAVDHAQRTAGRAIVHTSILLACGFTTFAASVFVGTLHFGLLTGWAVVTALFADLVLLGPLLIAFDGAPRGQAAPRH